MKEYLKWKRTNVSENITQLSKFVTIMKVEFIGTLFFNYKKKAKENGPPSKKTHLSGIFFD